MNNKSPALALLLASTLFTACGGGSSGTATPSVPEPPAPTPETPTPTTNIAPVVDGGAAQRVIVGSTVSLQGTASDTDGSIANVQWQQISGQTVQLQNTTNLNASFNAPLVSFDTALTFALTATDDQGASSQDNVIITIEGNMSPVVSAGEGQIVTAGDTILLQGQASDADGTIAEVQWIQTGGVSVDLQNADTLNAQFVAPPRTQTSALVFQLTATDNLGAASSANVEVKILLSPPTIYPANMLTANISNDGLADLVSYDNQSVFWYANLNQGAFSEPHLIATFNGSIRLSKVADVDADGDDDILITTATDISWVENKGDGTFAAPLSLINNWDISQQSTCLPETNPDFIRFLDIDNDGSLDMSWIAFCILPEDEQLLERLFFAKGNQNKQFGTPQSIKTYHIGGHTIDWGSPISLDILDINGDDQMEFVAKTQYVTVGGGIGIDIHKVEIYTPSAGSIVLKQDVGFYVTHQQSWSSHLIDLDHDGLLDVLGYDIARPSFTPIQISYRNLGDFNFPSWQDNTTMPTELHLDDSADINNDGQTDLITFDDSTTGYHVSWQQSSNDGYNESQVLFTIATKPKILRPLDWDNDGDLDYLVVSTDDTFSWVQNLGDGVFSHGNQP